MVGVLVNGRHVDSDGVAMLCVKEFNIVRVKTNPFGLLENNLVLELVWVSFSAPTHVDVHRHF